MRILQAPRNIANQAWATAVGLRALGHQTEVWQYGANPYGFPADRYIEEHHDPAVLVARFQDALNANFDVFHLHFGRSLIWPVNGLPWYWDLPVLRALGKKVVMTFHGTDIRKRSIHEAEDPWSFYRFADVPSDEARIDRSLQVLRTYCDRLIVASVLNTSLVPDAVYVPKTIDVASYEMTGPVREREPLVVHIPSSRATKGSEFVLRGVEELKERLNFRFVEGGSMTNTELKALYADADIIVDNLLMGDYEVSGLEAMAMGKPVIARIRPEVFEAHPDLPTVSADPDAFTQELGALIQDSPRRRALGEQGRAYVQTHHDAAVVAAALEPIYREPVKRIYATFPEWVSTPAKDKVPLLEERIRGLNVRIADLERRLEHRGAPPAAGPPPASGTGASRVARKARDAVRKLRGS